MDEPKKLIVKVNGRGHIVGVRTQGGEELDVVSVSVHEDVNAVQTAVVEVLSEIELVE